MVTYYGRKKILGQWSSQSHCKIRRGNQSWRLLASPGERIHPGEACLPPFTKLLELELGPSFIQKEDLSL